MTTHVFLYIELEGYQDLPETIYREKKRVREKVFYSNKMLDIIYIYIYIYIYVYATALLYVIYTI
jgi:hypothetical protein